MTDEEDPEDIADNSGEAGVEDAPDIALQPGPSADAQADVDRYISQAVRNRYDVYSYRHAAGILADSFPQELGEIEAALLEFSITQHDIGTPGGNESIIPKKFSYALRPSGWLETRIRADLMVYQERYTERLLANGKSRKVRQEDGPPQTVKNFIDGHKVDYVKGRVAFDLEWNSKDQTFDRDLYALRAFHECGLISAGVMVTRSASLNPVLARVPLLEKDGTRVGNKTCKAKYGASTTWMGKLLYRLNAGRHGGCPVLVFGIRPDAISDWPRS